jgi:hypothetical protein
MSGATPDSPTPAAPAPDAPGPEAPASDAPAPPAQGAATPGRPGLVQRLARALRRRPWEDDPDLAHLPEDADGYVRPRRRRTLLPPSFLVLLGAGLALLAYEPTLDLPYEVFGPGPAGAIDLGHAGDWHLENAQDGARVKLQGFAANLRGRYARWLNDYEVVPLAGLPVLVRRAPTPRPPEHAAEFYTGEGRLWRLDDGGSSWLERLFRPISRYTNVKNQFVAKGELPAGKTVWLLVEGDLPRTRAWPVLGPLLLWAGVALCARALWRSLSGR